MDNIRRTLEILFKSKNPEEIIEEFYSKKNKIKKFNRNYVSKEDFVGYFRNDYRKLYNKDEIENVYDLYGKKELFDRLYIFTEKVLIEDQGSPLCRYESLFRWRELSFQLDEDLLTTSFLGKTDSKVYRERKYFSWKPVIGNNNYRLTEILKKGMAENHFHLKGSGTHFNISWISLMNNIKGREKEFGELNKEKTLNPKIQIKFTGSSIDLNLSILKASAIRYFLNKLLRKKIESEEIKELKKLLSSKTVAEFKFNGENLNSKINAEKILYGKKIDGEIPDYCILKNMDRINFKDKSATGILIGERRFLYEVFKRIYMEDEVISKYKELFYAYIIIKENFRDEIIQVNKGIGFGNFGDYQNRKGIFIKEKSVYEKAIINSAVNASRYNQEIKYLEARIAPKTKDNLLKKEIKKLDDIVEGDIFTENKYKNIFLEKRKRSEKSYFYTIHFIKQNEKLGNNYKEILKCRNEKTRKQILKEAYAIEKMRKSNCLEGKRIYGIDGANVEIGCRPEVFAMVYRYLKFIENIDNSLIEKNDLFPLGRSFHVGEEFLDLADGLRAIDECIKFLNFDQGDRIGHGLALGIDPEEYYKSKEMILVLPKQDILDNVVWLMGQIEEKGIECKSSIKYKLENLYKRYYHEIYEKNNSNLKNYCYKTYYDSWKLRGDDPELYKNYEQKQKNKLYLIDYVRKNGNEGDEYFIARNNEKARELYYNYHYNPKVKKIGYEKDEFLVDYEYISLIKNIQKSLQKEVARKNLSIETNPSSNYLIGTFNKYCEHPITKFFNLGLTTDYEKIKSCPQISVSINTDDQGVFGTYLENEYALIALSLEKEIDENGERIYHPSMIYEWLDKIRQMGLEQSFFHRNKKLI